MAEGAIPAWGAVPLGGGQVRFRLWAPDHRSLTLRLGGTDHPMSAEEGGWFSLTTSAEPETPYTYVLPDGTEVPDPASRRQKDDVHGPSLVPHDDFTWRTEAWAGRPWADAVIYELHLGTFTEEGTARAAIERLDHLARTGITVVEILPVAQFGGDRGWGYDGVLPYAPHPAYGTPNDLRALVDACHERGMMAFLDVVYNHFGPDGNYLHAYASGFFDEARHTPWGAGIDYSRDAVRHFFIDNAIYWLEEFRFDGLRLDAVDQIHDPSDPELLVELARAVRAHPWDRPVHLTTEDNRNVNYLHVREPDGSVPLHSGEWNDDFHNAAHVAATGENEGYYADFADDPWGHLGRALAEGYAYQGQETSDGIARGQPSAHLPPLAFVDFLQNHDQTGNRAFGDRLITLTDRETHDALTAILLLSPHVPLIFMGEEYGETRPFCFFAGFEGDLGRAVTEGRRKEFETFSSFGAGERPVPDPIDPRTFEASRLDWSRLETPEGRAALDHTRSLLALRRDRIVPLLPGAQGGCGSLLAAEDGRLAVDWRLDGAILQLRANLSKREASLPPAEGELLHLHGSEPGAPSSVAHYLKAA